MNKIYSSDYDLDKTGTVLVTEKLQNLIDLASQKHACLVIEAGAYLTAPLFLESNMEFYLEKGAVLLGTTDESLIPIIPTRVAGIEMDWYPAILNCIGKNDVIISGEGTINGQGPYWWDKYWGKDMQGGMRKEYDQKNIRWACDYDCKRMRNVLISDSKNIVLKDFTSYQSGFWNIHLLYSKDLHIKNLHIASSDMLSPSTDGIDVDSCQDVLIEGCTIECNDDSIAIKSGRDSDGRRVARVCKNVLIKDCILNAGFGITLGSEVSGGIENIAIENITYNQTDCGFRIKSSAPRQGYIKNIKVSNLKLTNVKYLFHLCLNWNPNYCKCILPDDYQGIIPDYWKVLMNENGTTIKTKVDGIEIQNIKASYDEDYLGISRAFHIEGYEDEEIKNLKFKNMDIKCKEFGILEYVQASFQNVNIFAKEKHHKEHDNYDNR